MKKQSDELKILDSDLCFMQNPIDYDLRVTRFFKEKYGKLIEKIFCNIQKQTRSLGAPWLNELLLPDRKELIMRQTRPIFAAGTLSGGISKNHLLFCQAYVEAISMPLLSIDYSLDSYRIPEGETGIIQKSKLGEFCLTYEGFRALLSLPNGEEICKIVVENYNQIFNSLFLEAKERYRIDVITYPERRLSSVLRSRFSPLSCMYFDTTVRASFIINSACLDSDMLLMVQTFGRLRQLIDEIADVREDLIVGKASTPVLFALLSHSTELRESIIELWDIAGNDKAPNSSKRVLQLADEIKLEVQANGGYDRAYQLANLWYKKALHAVEKCPTHNCSNNEVKLLFRLKRAFLERLRITNWNDTQIYNENEG